jgi:excisionase family DNA binding protein
LRFSFISNNVPAFPIQNVGKIMSIIVHPPINLPVEREVKAAIEGQRALAAYLATQFETQHIQIFDEQNEAHRVELPTSALRLLVDILAALAEGNAVKVVPIHAELTTQEAADLLNVSRPHMIKLLESGEISYHKTGKHRRVRFADLMDYRSRRDTASEQAMALLAEQAQALRTGYE